MTGNSLDTGPHTSFGNLQMVTRDTSSGPWLFIATMHLVWLPSDAKGVN